MSQTPQEKPRTKPLTPLSSGQMSSGLKDRLKRSGRYHTSTPAKRLCLDKQTINFSPIHSTSHSELSDVSHKRLEIAQERSSSSSICAEHNLNTTVPKLCTDDVNSSFQSPAMKTFYRSPFSTKNITSNFISPANTSISRTPLSSKRTGRILSKSARLNFSQDDSKIKNDLCPNMDLSQEQKNTSSLSVSRNTVTDLADASLRLMENKQKVFTSKKEQNSSLSKVFVNSKESQKTVSSENQKLVLTKKSLLQEIKVKEETLRKLRMVKMYRSKNNLSHLQVLIDKWHDLSQQSLQDLLQLLPEPKPSMSELLQHLQIETNLVNFDSAEETFT